MAQEEKKCWWKESSKSRYEELEKAAQDNRTCSDCNATVKSVLGGALAEYGSLEKAVPNIMNAWCYLNKKTEDERSKYCDIFYYWLGSLILNTPNSRISIPNVVMETIYDKLQAWKNMDNCRRTIPKVTKDDFERLKALYHYTQDYNHLGDKINTVDGSCPKEYEGFLKEINRTYTDRGGRCTYRGFRKDEYCEEIEKIISGAPGTIENPSNLLSPLDRRLTPLTNGELEHVPEQLPANPTEEEKHTSHEQAQEEISPVEEASGVTATTATPSVISDQEGVKGETDPSYSQGHDISGHTHGDSHSSTANNGGSGAAASGSAGGVPGFSTPAETTTGTLTEQSPPEEPGIGPYGMRDSRGNHRGPSSPLSVTTETNGTQHVTTEAQRTQLAVTETWTSEKSSNMAIDLMVGLTKGIVVPSTPVLLATWALTLLISIAVLLCKYTSLFRAKSNSPLKRRKRKCTVEPELNTSLGSSASATEHSTESGSITASRTVDDSASGDDSIEEDDKHAHDDEDDDVVKDDSSSSLCSTRS
ncbi:KIR-like protein [Plasmodium knowlesi strain H]|uniref:KIR-like protein n=3 Tax=Plasmodium knowlesi TaxID=5850 RepID=A0A5K1UZQ5_PLAKH|nr:KIR-like protein [Plasmodium knowlesi strain H]OTN66992.1 KIR-like protein [Plasmodium knowlesi]CAA9988517.1 KIR-like protein [Plasmodium knowlesi strain H]SBO21283.1 KIR-like protein [Plasmodium knowlesi strain H]SBO21736.1 KIR-like protein [Plasmodium knowlesi strain H]VVS77991.1 KIR-like protein [Plasmodium knowlesi strain H]|eukprot:XP_002259492.1 KIR-like protein [Plasmodium knowlesi strain H]